jgi:hypothetical protein
MKDLIRRILREHTDKVEVKEFARYDRTQVLDILPQARVLFSLSQEFQNTENTYYKQIFLNQAQLVLREWTNRPPQYVSEKVLQRFLTLAPNINPYNIHRHGKKQLRGKNVSINISDLVWEHTTPVNYVIKKIMEADDLEQVVDALNQFTGICWVTKEEDQCLDKSGFRRERPDWKKAYQNCNINPISKNQYLEMLKRIVPVDADISKRKQVGDRVPRVPKGKMDLLKYVENKKERGEIASKWKEILKNNGTNAIQHHKNYPEYLRVGKPAKGTVAGVELLFGKKENRLGVKLEEGLHKRDNFKWILESPQLIVDDLSSKFPGLNFKSTDAINEKTFNFDFDRFNFEQSNIDLLKNIINEFAKIIKIYE